MMRRGSWFHSGPGSSFRQDSLRSVWHNDGHTGLFRSADLNTVGWLAVLGPGVVIGAAVAVVTGRSWWVLVALGAICSWLIALALDTIAWRKITAGIGLPGLDRSQVEAVLSRLRAQGVDVALHDDIDAETGRPSYSLHSTNRFMKVIRVEIDDEHNR